MGRERGSSPKKASELLKWRDAIFESPSPPAGLTSTQRLVAQAVAKHVNSRTLTAFAGVDRLARLTALHRSTVRDALASLVDAGWLVLLKKGGADPGHKRMANEYRISSPTGSAGPPVVVGDRSNGTPRPVVLDSATGSPGRPQLDKNSYMNSRRALSPAEFAAKYGGCRHESTMAERAAEAFSDPADQIEVVTEWHRLNETEASL